MIEDVEKSGDAAALRQEAARRRRAADGLRPPRLPRRGPAGPRAASYGEGARRARATRSPRRSRRPRWPSCKERRPDRVLETNVEFWAAIVLDFAEVPANMFTSMFTCARTGGWSAHILEQKSTGRLIRPSAIYVGPGRRARPRTSRAGTTPGATPTREPRPRPLTRTLDAPADRRHRPRDGYTVLSPQGRDRLRHRAAAASTPSPTRWSPARSTWSSTCTAVDVVESTGLGALIGGRRRARALNGSLTLVCAETPVLKVFRVTGLDKVFEIHDSIDDVDGLAADGRRRAAGPRASDV